MSEIPPRLRCCYCERDANEIAGEGRYLNRVNKPGDMPAVWKCEPPCPAATGTAGEPSEEQVERAGKAIAALEWNLAPMVVAIEWAQDKPSFDRGHACILARAALRAAAAGAAPADGPDVLLPWLRHHRTCGVNEGGACGCGLESAIHGAAPAGGPTKNCPTCGPTATVHHPGRDWCVSCQWEHRGAAPADDKLASLAARMERVAEKWEQVPGEQMPLVANDFRYMARLLRKAVGA
jgi:hypothetical protein